MISCGNVLELSSEYLDGSIWWVSCTGAGVLFSSGTQGSLRLPQRSLRAVDGLLLLRRIRCMAINPRSSLCMRFPSLVFPRMIPICARGFYCIQKDKCC